MIEKDNEIIFEQKDEVPKRIVEEISKYFNDTKYILNNEIDDGTVSRLIDQETDEIIEEKIINPETNEYEMMKGRIINRYIIRLNRERSNAKIKSVILTKVIKPIEEE